MLCDSRWLHQTVWMLKQYAVPVLHTTLHSFGFPKVNFFFFHVVFLHSLRTLAMCLMHPGGPVGSPTKALLWAFGGGINPRFLSCILVLVSCVSEWACQASFCIAKLLQVLWCTVQSCFSSRQELGQGVIKAAVQRAAQSILVYEAEGKYIKRKQNVHQIHQK